MKTKIRYGVFETNSSSEHAICVPKKHIKKDDIELEHIQFDHQDFERRTQVFTNFQDKVNYLFQAIWDVYSRYDDIEFKKKCSEAYNHIYDILGKYGVECSFTEQHTEEEKGYYGQPIEFERGSIDHGGELRPWVEKCLSNEKYLLTYLFGDSIVVTGSDEGRGGYLEDELDKLNLDDYEIWYKYCG